MRVLAFTIGLVLILGCFQDIFEAVLLPRRIDRDWRFMLFFYRCGWRCWSRVAKHIPAGRQRESLIAIFGPLSMILLFAIWGLSLVLGFGFLQWSLPHRQHPPTPLSREMDLSANAFFTLGTDEQSSCSQLSLVLIFIEAATGFGFIALMVSYLPVLYSHFAQRDARLVQLGARAGVPANAGTVLIRYASLKNSFDLELWLAEWERWAADLVETHSAYPMLAFYRSQHENQSWLATLGVLLDLTTLMLVVGPEEFFMSASGAFVSSRRVLEEICVSWGVTPLPKDKLSPRVAQEHRVAVMEWLKATKWAASQTEEDPSLEELVQSYEPKLQALSQYLLLPLPRLFPEDWNAQYGAISMTRAQVMSRLMQ